MCHHTFDIELKIGIRIVSQRVIGFVTFLACMSCATLSNGGYLLIYVESMFFSVDLHVRINVTYENDCEEF